VVCLDWSSLSFGFLLTVAIWGGVGMSYVLGELQLVQFGESDVIS
jgi:hypothetical protein